MVFILFMIIGEKPYMAFSSEHVGIRSNPEVLYFYSSQTETKEESGWRKAGVIGLEFVGSSVVTTPFVLLCVISSFEENWFLYYYLIGTPVVSSSTVITIGNLLGERGSTWKSLIGGLIGSSLGFTALYMEFTYHPYRKYIPDWSIIGCIYLASSLGATIGYNL